jgi:hypothetical protein
VKITFFYGKDVRNTNHTHVHSIKLALIIYIYILVYGSFAICNPLCFKVVDYIFIFQMAATTSKCEHHLFPRQRREKYKNIRRWILLNWLLSYIHMYIHTHIYMYRECPVLLHPYRTLEFWQRCYETLSIKQRISWPVEGLLNSQEWLWSMEWDRAALTNLQTY